MASTNPDRELSDRAESVAARLDEYAYLFDAPDGERLRQAVELIRVMGERLAEHAAVWELIETRMDRLPIMRVGFNVEDSPIEPAWGILGRNTPFGESITRLPPIGPGEGIAAEHVNRIVEAFETVAPAPEIATDLAIGRHAEQSAIDAIPPDTEPADVGDGRSPAELHLAAMKALDRHEAMTRLARRVGEKDRSKWPVLDLWRAANLERQAAECYRDRPEHQPTRAVLYRSAATLALRCGRVEACRELCREGLVNAPAEIAAEIEELMRDLDGRAAPGANGHA